MPVSPLVHINAPATLRTMAGAAEKEVQTTHAAVCRGGWYGKKGARISAQISTIPILHLDLRKRCQLCDACLYLP